MQLGWIDFSQKERHRIVSILKVLGDQSAVDMLGIGLIRDTFSNLLFPGISVQQTRAKYFVLVPYIFADAEKEKYSTRKDVKTYIDKKEDSLIKILSKNSGNTPGIIGIRKDTAKHKASYIYWSGLRTLEILKNPAYSLGTAYGYVFNKSKKNNAITLKGEGEDSAADDRDVLKNGDVLFMPIDREGKNLKESTMELTKKEAEFLKYHFTEAALVKDSLMAYILKNPSQFFDMTNGRPKKLYKDFVDVDEIGLNESLKETFVLAKEFSKFIYGAHILYNIIFAEGCKVNDEKLETLRKEYDAWINSEEVKIDLDKINKIVTIAKCDEKTAEFLKDWYAVFQKEKNQDEAKKLIIKREKGVKPGRRKLNNPEHYQYTSPIHYHRLDYRYETAMTILADILEGLNC